jgi:hypothetical protein
LQTKALDRGAPAFLNTRLIRRQNVKNSVLFSSLSINSIIVDTLDLLQLMNSVMTIPQALKDQQDHDLRMGEKSYKRPETPTRTGPSGDSTITQLPVDSMAETRAICDEVISITGRDSGNLHYLGIRLTEFWATIRGNLGSSSPVTEELPLLDISLLPKEVPYGTSVCAITTAVDPVNK